VGIVKARKHDFILLKPLRKLGERAGRRWLAIRDPMTAEIARYGAVLSQKLKIIRPLWRHERIVWVLAVVFVKGMLFVIMKGICVQE
jgi:hypothetical protein